MTERHYLQIPGPTNIPEQILRSLSTPMVNHRGPVFKKIVEKVTTGLQESLHTSQDILIFPSSGSGALEASVVNLFSKGDKIITTSQGVFSDRYGKIANVFGVDVIEIKKEWGSDVTPEDISELLEKDADHEIKAVCLPHNETTTGVVNDIQGIVKAIKALDHPALIVVDGISSIACVPFYMDQWGVDVLVTSSQKGLMLPPGLGIVCLNARSWEMVEKSNLPKWYWDFKAVKNRMKDGQFPYTPATSLFYGLEVSLKLLQDEGIENVWKRHHENASAVRAAGSALGLDLLSGKEAASDTVSAFRLPEGIDYNDLSRILREKHHITIGGGLGQLSGKIFRIGHLGALEMTDVLAIMGALELALIELGYSVDPGTVKNALAGFL